MTAIQTGVKPSIVLIWFIFEHYVWKCHSEQSTIAVDRYIALQTMWAQRGLHQNAPSLAVLQVPISVKLWIRQNSSVHSVYSGQISSPKQSGVETKYVSHLRENLASLKWLEDLFQLDRPYRLLRPHIFSLKKDQNSQLRETQNTVFSISGCLNFFFVRQYYWTTRKAITIYKLTEWFLNIPCLVAFAVNLCKIL